MKLYYDNPYQALDKYDYGKKIASYIRIATMAAVLTLARLLWD